MLLPLLMLTAALAQEAPAPAVPEQLVIAVSVTDKKGKPIEDMKQDEFVVQQDGKPTAIRRVELDRRPLSVALVLDSSAAIGSSFHADVVPAALSFVNKLPFDTAFSIWTTSDRPKPLIENTTDKKAIEDQIRAVAPLGENAAVDTLVAASQAIAQDDSRRSAVVLVTSSTMGNISADAAALIPKASLKPTYLVAELIVGEQDARLEDTIKLLVGRTAGFHERIFSTMAVQTQLLRIADAIGSIYRIAYVPAGDPR
jgi:hypothetical protein